MHQSALLELIACVESVYDQLRAQRAFLTCWLAVVAASSSSIVRKPTRIGRSFAMYIYIYIYIQIDYARTAREGSYFLMVSFLFQQFLISRTVSVLVYFFTSVTSNVWTFWFEGTMNSQHTSQWFLALLARCSLVGHMFAILYAVETW